MPPPVLPGRQIFYMIKGGNMKKNPGVYTKRFMRTLLLLAAFAAATSFTGISAYMTSADGKANTFVVGEVKAKLEEPSWAAADPDNIVPGQELDKDPIVKNTGSSDLYTFLRVSVPKREIYTYDPDPAQNPEDPGQRARNPLAVTELFTLPPPNAGWTLLDTDRSAPDHTDCIFAYGSSTAMTRLAPGTQTVPVFDHVQYCYAVEGQGLDEEALNIVVSMYAIQADDLTGNDTGDPFEVWELYSNQAEREK